jgi:hypothetical protein
MKKIIMISAIACFLIDNTTFGMLNKCTKISKNIRPIRQYNRRNQFNRAELLQQLEEEQHRFTPEQMTLLKRMITNSTEPCEPGKTKDRDFEHNNTMNKE